MSAETEVAETVEAAGRAVRTSLVLRGILALIVGVVALVQPDLALLTLILLFGIFAIVDGVFAIVGSLLERDHSWGWGVLLGLVGLGIGLVALRRPEGAGTVLVLIIAAWALISGLFQIYGAFVLRSAGARNWGWVLFAGVVSFAVGLVFFIDPLVGAKTIVLIFGIYMVVLGLALLIAGFAFKNLTKDVAAEVRAG